MPPTDNHPHTPTPTTPSRPWWTLLLLLLTSLTWATASDWASRLSNEHGMDLAACPFTLTQRPEPTRVILQVIQNTFHKWEEHDLPDGRTCLVQIEPFARTLTPTTAQQLLHNSSAWMGQELTPLPHAADLSRTAYGAASAMDELDRGGTVVEPQFIHGTDDRVKIANTLQFPYVASGNLLSSYGSTNRGNSCTAFLVSAHTALTNGHCITATRKDLSDLDEHIPGHAVELGDRASRVLFAPAQFGDGVSPVRPFGLWSAVDWKASDDYVSELLKWSWLGDTRPYDYGAVHFHQSFAALGIDTYVPVVFNTHPDEIAIAGYPGRVECLDRTCDESNSSPNDGSMWQSHSPVERINNRTLTYKADTSGGMSGSPIWQISPLRVVGLHAYGNYFANGGPRLVLENSVLISDWMNWDPPPSPPNNLFADAFVLPFDSGSETGTTVGAFRESGEPENCGSNPSVWLRWTPSASGKATFSIDPDPLPAGFPQVTVYEGSSLQDLQPVTTCISLISDGEADVVAGREYFIQVTSQDPTPSFSFSWNLTVPGDAPSVTSFTASPTSIVEGSPSTLSWSVTGSEPINLFITGGVGNVTGSSNAVVYPATTTTYTLTTTNEYGSDSRHVTVNVTPASGGGEDGLFARITTNPIGQARVNQVVTLDGTASTFGDGNRSVYEFDSGDGRTRQEAWGEWIMNYPTAGSYQPCVRVRNTLNQWSAWACTSINIVNEAPTGPDLTILKYEQPGYVGPSDPSHVFIDQGDGFDMTVHWWNDGADLPSNHPTFYLQLLIDGQPIASRSYRSPSPPGDMRTFTGLGSDLEPGEYTVVIMIDATNVIQETNELNNSRSFTLRVDSLPPVADFSTTTECLTASFTDASSHPTGNSNIILRSWEFRDGNTSTLRDPVHTYEEAGSYNVRLTVTDKWGNTHRRTRSVTVEECHEPTEPPNIDAFWSNPESITIGQGAILSWIVTGTQPITLTLDQDIGDVTGSTSMNVTPEATTTYTLTATNEAGTTSANATVTLYQELPPGETPIAEMRLLPLASDCDTSAIGQPCTLTIATSDSGSSEAFAAAQFMVWSPAFSVQGVTPAGIAENCLASAGPETIGIICDEAPINTDGVIAEITLRREEPGDATIDVLDVWLYDSDGIPYAAAGGSLELTEPPDPEFTCEMAHYADHPLGDFNADGIVSTPDALLILRTAVASLPAPEPGSYQHYHGDLNSDGHITTADALLALQKAVDPTRPARLAVAPRNLTLEPGESACVLICNAGSQPLPDLTITTPDGITATDITHDDAIGHILRITRTTGTGTITINANDAGTLTITVNP